MKSLTPEERAQLTAGMTPQEKETVVALINPTLLVAGELLQTRLLTDIYSQRQLQAVMTDFWLNHFNVFLKKGQFAPWYLADYQQNVIAPHAMGKFEDLLVATAKSPAMLFYLDNHSSIGPHSLAAERAQANPASKNKDPGLNENYARELMELHTLGVDGGYTQKDVTEVAKVFTGWTIEDPRKGVGFTFNERRHEPGPKSVWARPFRRMANRRVLPYCTSSEQPCDGAYLSQQLAERFVSDIRRRRWWTAWQRLIRIAMAISARCCAPCLPRRSSGPARRIAPRSRLRKSLCCWRCGPLEAKWSGRLSCSMR